MGWDGMELSLFRRQLPRMYVVASKIVFLNIGIATAITMADQHLTLLLIDLRIVLFGALLQEA